MKQRIVGTGFAALIAILAYQAEPISATIGWVVVALLTIAVVMSFRR